MCTISAFLQRLFQGIFLETLDNVKDDIRVNGTPIINILYEDNTIIMASNLSSLHNIMDKVVENSKQRFANKRLQN